MSPTPRSAYHRVPPLLWDESWDDDTFLVALYIITGPYRVTEGLFRFKLPHAAYDRGWKLPRFERAFARLVSDRFLEYDGDAEVVLLVPALEWQWPQNPNQIKGALNALEQLPDTPLLLRLHELIEFHAGDNEKRQRFLQAFRERFAQRLAQPLPNGSPNGSGNRPETLLAPSSSSESKSKSNAGSGTNGDGPEAEPPGTPVGHLQVLSSPEEDRHGPPLGEMWKITREAS